MEQQSFYQQPGFSADRFESSRLGSVHSSELFQAPEPQGNVTEIILPTGQIENFQLLLPMMTQLNQERRWLAWIDPPQELVAKWQANRGIVHGDILLLRSSANKPALKLAEQALGAGTCHAVVLWTDRLSRTQMRTLEAASARGDSHGVVLRQR